MKKRLCYSEAEIAADPNLRGQLDPMKVRRLAEYCVGLLERGEWKPKPCRHITKKSPTTGKVREIDVPALEDHVIHWMIILAIKPIIQRGMIENSCACPGKEVKPPKGWQERQEKNKRKRKWKNKRGIEYGRRKIEKFARKTDAKYHVKLDGRKCFPSLSHAKLKQRVREVIKDRRMLEVIDIFIDTLPGDYGLCIGTYPSPWLLELLFQPLDHYIQEGLYKTRRGKRVKYVKHYVRQMDDIILFGSSKRDLEKAVREIIAFAWQELGITIKAAWEIKSFGDVQLDALGYRFDGVVVRVRKIIFLRTKRTAKRIFRLLRRGLECPIRLVQGLVSRLGWFTHAAHRHFEKLYITPYVDVKELKGAISNESKKRCIAAVPC